MCLPMHSAFACGGKAKNKAKIIHNSDLLLIIHKPDWTLNKVIIKLINKEDIHLSDQSKGIANLTFF